MLDENRTRCILSGSSFSSSSTTSQGREMKKDEREGERRRKGKERVADFEGRVGRKSRRVTERGSRRRRRRRNLLSSYPQPFSIQIEAAKKAQGTHARTHKPEEGAGPHRAQYPSPPPPSCAGLSLVFVHVRASEGRFHRTVNITVTNTGSMKGGKRGSHPPSHTRVSYNASMRKGLAYALAKRLENPRRMPLLLSSSLLSRVDPVRVCIGEQRVQIQELPGIFSRLHRRTIGPARLIIVR